MGCADSAALDGRCSSNVYEFNLWLWQFGRGKPRLGGLTVEETAYRQLAKDVDQKKRAAETPSGILPTIDVVGQTYDIV